MRAHYKFWPKRLPHRITPPATSLWDNLAISARRYPDKAALVFFGRVFSYQDVLRKAERLAARLAALGVQKGDRVVLNMQNCPQLVIAHFAILRANAVVVPVNPMNRAEELKHYITDPDAKVALTTSDLAAELARASDALARRPTAGAPDRHAFHRRLRRQREWPRVGPDDLCVMPYTSGTTGHPRAACTPPHGDAHA
jgi:fatty-acyl-CoA synthase